MITFPKIFPIACHTDNVGTGSTFVAIKGMKEDGSRYILKALELGAQTIVVETSMQLSQDILDAIKQASAKLVYVENTRKALAELSAQAHNYPAQKLKIIGITGTKGKSSTTFLVEHMLKTAGYRTALLSTVKNRILDTDFTTHLTTQQPDYLHIFLAACVEQKIDWVVMEVAAQATSLYRTHGIMFDLILFTNFSREHGEFYATMDEYFAAKAHLCLQQFKPSGTLILNAQDTAVAALKKQVPAARFFDITQAHITRQDLSGVAYTYAHINFMCATLFGDYNVANLLAATTCAEILEIPYATVQKAWETFPGVPGRLNRYALPNGAIAYIDYAHNPASYQAVLSMLRDYTDDLIVVFGAGGDRDATRRPLMGAIAATYANKIVLTSDNPRSEDPATIAQAVYAGIPQELTSKVTIELDREQAIKKAYTLSGAGSVIVLLGKGPDEYQIYKGVKTYFSEKNILLSF